MIGAIAIILGSILLKVWHDARMLRRLHQRKTTRTVNHPVEWLILAVVNAYPLYFFTKASTLHPVSGTILSGAMIAFFIWFFFDGLYNLVRRENWWFTGTPHKGSANTDKFLRRLKLWQHITLKVILLAGTISLYLFTKK